MFKKLLALGALCSLGALSALEMSNPSSPELPQEGIFIPRGFVLGVRAEYQMEKVFDKSLHPSTPYIKSVEGFEEEVEVGILSLSFADQFELYSILGGNRIQLATKITDTILQEYTTGNRFRWGFGAKGQIFSYNSKGALALDLKYICTSPSIETLTVNGTLIPQHLKMKYDEWQLGLGASYQFEMFSPYIGVQYSHPTVKIYGFRNDLLPRNKDLYRLHGKKKFGISAGTTIAALKGFALNIEMRAINENAVSLTTIFSF